MRKLLIFAVLAISALSFISCKKCGTCTWSSLDGLDANGNWTYKTETTPEYCGDEWDVVKSSYVTLKDGKCTEK